MLGALLKVVMMVVYDIITGKLEEEYQEFSALLFPTS